MEQKKTLWIALSAGIFLLVVLGAALVIYSPGARPGASAVAMRENGQLWTASLPSQSPSQGGLIATNKDPSALVSGSYNPTAAIGQSSLPGTNAGTSGANPTVQEGILKTDKLTVISETTNVYATDGIASQPSGVASASTSASSGNVIAMNQKSESVIQETGNKKKVEEPASAKPTPVAASTSKAPASSTAAVAKSSGQTSTAKSTGQTASAKSSPASGSSASSKSTIAPAAHYWVQVASYSTKDNADEARKVLDSKDLPCEVFTFTKDSKLYYRVRVGPYKTKSEAETCKKSVDSIALFKSAQSYVVDSSARASR
ncbi:MAG: SPOR domain-containing protein [Treponema sp.]|nr:SPOR domain-containing protein [Treponema sp.]